MWAMGGTRAFIEKPAFTGEEGLVAKIKTAHHAFPPFTRPVDFPDKLLVV